VQDHSGQSDDAEVEQRQDDVLAGGTSRVARRHGGDRPLSALTGRRLAPMVAAAVLGGGLAAAGTHAWDTRARPAASARIDVRVSLGAGGAGLDQVQDGRAVVALDVVLFNAGRSRLSLTQIRVEGPGAGFVASPPGGPSTYLPADLPPGEFTHVRFGLSSDCSVGLRPEPRVTLLLRGSNGHVSQEVAAIPDLASIWGLTLTPDACRPAR
jgi:hypothetical protein